MQASPSGRGAATLLLLALALGPGCCRAALNVGVDGADSLVTELRRSIFVDTAYLAEREQERCSSIDGPKCLRFLMAGGAQAEPRARSFDLDGPGVLPERMLRGLGGAAGHDLDFSTPLYHELEALRRQHSASPEAAPHALVSLDDAAALRGARAGARHGALHFGELLPDRRVPLSFSRGLPGGVVATWDGRWIVRSCPVSEEPPPPPATSPPGSAWPLALPAPPSKALADPSLPVVLPSAQAVGPSRAGPLTPAGLSAVAELAGSVGYLRFSQPVVVRSLFARWAPEAGAPPAVISGRLGLQSIWSTHIDSKRLKHHDWIDISAGSLAPVDELAFLSAPGLELAALWAVAHGGDFDDGGSERTVMLLEPVFNTSLSADFSRPRFTVKTLSVAPAATPFLVSLQEAVERNLQLHLEPSAWAAPHSHGVAANYPALLTTESAAVGRWTPAAVASQRMLEHELLMLMPGGHPDAAEHVVAALLQLSSGLPADLRREIEHEREAIVDALQSWASTGGKWRRTDPSSLPINGSEVAVQSYMRAKRAQARLDLLTAAFLQLRPRAQAQQQQQQHPNHGQRQPHTRSAPRA